MGCRGDPSGQDERSDGETVHARGDDGCDGRVRPYGWQWNVNDEHWDGCTSVFDLRWNVRVMGCKGDPSGQDERIDGETVHARGDDGWRWVGRPYGWQWNVNARMQGWMSQCF